LETPSYKVLDAVDGVLSWEVREYNSFSVVSSAMTGSESGGAGAFQALASYIFGRNQDAEKMAMTTPVITTTKSGAKTMNFVMPSAYAASPPRPMDGSPIVVKPAVEMTNQTLAVLWFSGFCSEASLAERYQQLEACIEAPESKWKIASSGDGSDPITMQYNDPFTAPWKRRNEVALAVVPK